MTATAALPAADYRMHSSILREYDIRGVVGETLFEDDAYLIGRGFASELTEQLGRPPVLAVARDGRLSSPAICDALVRGLVASGAQVQLVGVGPTPMLYFSVYHLHADGGIMVTGSHNPPTHNGFKMMAGKASFFGEQIVQLGNRIAAQQFVSAQGNAQEKTVSNNYVQKLAEALPASGRTLKVAWDPGNGAAGEIIDALTPHLAGTHIAINTAIDGRFPAHHPDPSVQENMRQLAALVTENGCDIGLAFDGDADRLGAVDNKGRMIAPDQLLMLLAREVLSQQKGTIIADVKTSQAFFDDVATHGGRPMMYKTGHSHIKAKMKEVGALFAGEASGHLFYADRYYGFDDGIYAGLRLMGALAQSNTTLSDLVDGLPQILSTPEIRLPCPDDRKFEVVREVKERLAAEGADFTDIDGVRVRSGGGWWLIRASNTQGVINARCEATSPSELATLTETLRTQLALSGLSLEL